jgi:methyl-accepting chemotaxis protein
MAEIATASQEQSTGIEQINQAVTEMDSTTQQNAALVEQATATSELLQAQADKLAHAGRQFKLGKP